MDISLLYVYSGIVFCTVPECTSNWCLVVCAGSLLWYWSSISVKRKNLL